jgi:hypothetical protein
MLVNGFKLMGQGVNTAGVQGGLRVNGMGQPQPVRVQAQPETSGIAVEGDAPPVGRDFLADLRQLLNRQNISAGLGLTGGVNGQGDMFIGARLNADDLDGRRPKRGAQPIARLHLLAAV